jgi:hypothetical protein
MCVVLGLAGLLLAAATGCEAYDCEGADGESAKCLDSLKRYELPENPAPETVAWQSGQNVTVNGRRGDITIRQGSADQVTVHFVPFNYRSHQKEDEARDELAQYLTLAVTTDATGILVTTERDNASNDGLGADIFVDLPPNFDGMLDLFNDGDGIINPGNINVQFVGMAHQVDVVNGAGVGTCTIMGAPSVTTTVVACDDDVHVENVSDSLAIAATSLDTHITVSLASISADAANSTITTEDGTIDISFPSEAGFQAMASAPGGLVDAGVVPSACTMSTEADVTEVTCAGDGTLSVVPIYTLTAGGSFGDNSVTLRYH